MKEIEQAEGDQKSGWAGGWKKAAIFKRAVGMTFGQNLFFKKNLYC